MMIEWNPRQLQVFAAIASSGSVRAAAEKLCISQPAASMALAGLEQRLGCRLFDRVRQRLMLNDRGARLLPRVQDVLARLEELPGALMNGGDGAALSGRLHLGASNTIGNYLVGDLLGTFLDRHPAVTVDLAIGNTADVVTSLVRFRIDLGCVEGMVAAPGIEAIPWRSDRLVLCSRPDHPLALRPRLSPGDFTGLRWILREPGSATRALAEAALARLPPPRDVLVLGQSEAIRQAVIAGLGIACLPEIAVADAVAAGRLAILRTPFLDLGRRLSIIVHRDRPRSAEVDALLAILTGPEITAGSSPSRPASAT